MVNVANPDEDYTQGQGVSFGAPESSVPFCIPWWVYAAAGVLGVLVVVAVVILVTRNGDIPVPDVAELSAEEAINRLVEAGLQVSEVTEAEASDTVEEVKVIRTEPPPGGKVSRSTVITLVLSTGPEEVPTIPPPVLDSPETRNGFLSSNAPTLTGNAEGGPRSRSWKREKR